MALPDHIRAAADRATGELVAAYDYYSDTKSAWTITALRVAAGDQFDFKSDVTGTLTTQADLEAKRRGYVAGFLAEATFQQFLAVFEAFVADLLRLWLTAHPRGLGGKPLTLHDVLDAGDVPAVIDRVVAHEVGEVTYKSPRMVFKYLGERTGIALPAASDIDQLAEAKATRDLLVHNRGVVDAEYRKKAGGGARSPIGDRIEVDEPYHRKTWELLKRLVIDIATAAVANASTPGGVP